MQGSASTSSCPRCGSLTFRHWSELSDDQKLLAEKLPASADFTEAERKKHRYCTRCWFEGPEVDHLA